MTKRRTRKEKIGAKRITPSYTHEPDVARINPDKASGAILNKPTNEALYEYDTGMITKDLLKTVYISVMILSLEFGLYLYLR
jgi:hypothetical protein